MMSAKIHVNLAQGLIEVEGQDDFVRSVYDDLKDVIASRLIPVETGDNPDVSNITEPEREKPAKAKSKRSRAAPRKKADSKATAPATKYHPKLDPTLPIEKLEDFYGKFEPSNQSERILIFCKYISEATGNNACTLDQIFTCVSALRETHPSDYLQAMRDAKRRSYGYVTYTNTDDITVTLIGENHFNKKIKRKSAE